MRKMIKGFKEIINWKGWTSWEEAYKFKEKLENVKKFKDY